MKYVCACGCLLQMKCIVTCKACGRNVGACDGSVECSTASLLVRYEFREHALSDPVRHCPDCGKEVNFRPVGEITKEDVWGGVEYLVERAQVLGRKRRCPR